MTPVGAILPILRSLNASSMVLDYCMLHWLFFLLYALLTTSMSFHWTALQGRC